MRAEKLKLPLKIVRLESLSAVALAVLVVAVLTAAICAQSTGGQSFAILPQAAPSAPPPANQSLEAMEAAGVKMAFDVASVKPNKSSDRPYSNVPLVPGLVPPPSGGLFSETNNPLIVYIAFAYNLTTDQALRLLPQLSGWVFMDRFDIQARADGNPTLDQMRLMMQSLLADRFKLKAHTETKLGPVYALVLVKPGKTGSQLQPNAEPCSSAPNPSATGGGSSRTSSAPSSTTGLQLPPMSCGSFSPLPPSAPGRMRIGARGVAIGLIANLLPGVSLTAGAGVDRPVLDRTGLSGTFDFTLEFTTDSGAPPRPNFQPDPSAPTLLEALREQLGLKLEPATGPVSIFSIDHIEEPSAN